MKLSIFSPMKVAAAALPPSLEMVDWWDPSVNEDPDTTPFTSLVNQIGGRPSLSSTGANDPTAHPMETAGDGPSALNGILFANNGERLTATLPEDNVNFVMMLFFVLTTNTATKAMMGTLTGGTNAPLLQLGATNGRFNVLLDPGGVVAQTSAAAIATDSAFAIAVSYDGTTLRISRYPGASAASSATADIKLASGATFSVGGASGKSSMDAQLGDIQIWKNFSGDATDLSNMLQTFYNDTVAKYWP